MTLLDPENWTNRDLYYYPVKGLRDFPVRLLYIARYKLSSNYFHFGNIKRRHDAIVFLKSSHSISREGFNSFMSDYYFKQKKEKEYRELLKKN